MFISIDIGGTNTKIACSENLQDIKQMESFPSQKKLEDETASIKKLVAEFSANQKIQGYAVGAPGILDKKSFIVKQAPNYSELNGVNLKELISAEDSAVFLCANDSEIAALGEAVLGAGEDFNSVAYISIGTGIGGALIENKRLSSDQKFYEPGHQIINMGSDVRDGYGIIGSWEVYASGTGFKKKYGMELHACKDKEIWFEFGRKIGAGLQNVILMWSPDCIVLGGGVSTYFDLFLPGINDWLAQLTFVQKPKILKSIFGQGSGVSGGFVLLSQQGIMPETALQ